MSREKILCGKDEIFRVATSIVDSDGMNALSVRSIAKELGISPMTIYNYVENLRDIQKRILIGGFDRMYASVFNALNELEAPIDKVSFCKGIALSVYDFAVSNRQIFSYMFSSGQCMFHEDAEVRPLYTFIYKLAKRSKATQQDWAANEKGYRLLESLIFSISYQISSGASTLSREEYGDLIDFYLEKCIV